MVERNKLLIIGPPKSGKITLVKNLFNSIPEQVDKLHSGLIHDVKLQTKYYTKDVQLWIDEFGDSNLTQEVGTDVVLFQKWAKEFKSDEYKEIRDVLAGIVLCINLADTSLSEDKDIVQVAKEIVDILDVLKRDKKQNNELAKKLNVDEKPKEDYDYESNQWDGFIIIVGIEKNNSSFVDSNSMKEIFWDHDLDFVKYNENKKEDPTERDEYGDKLGLLKIKEIVECHDWSNIKLTIPNEHYQNINDDSVEKLESMKTPLTAEKIVVSEKSDKALGMDMEKLVRKINNAKENAANIENHNDREKFAKDFIDEIIDYI